MLKATLNYQEIYEEALEAGELACKCALPAPMVVESHLNQADDSSPVVKQYYVPEGLCGFAWVNVSPATQPFARWLKKTGIVDSKAYYGGYDLWCWSGGQSIERKEAWAKAVQDVLNKYGIKCYANSRLD